MQFNKITSNSPAYAEAAKTFDSLTDRFDYDALALAYNDLKPTEMLQFEYKRGKGAVVKQQLEKRGLKQGDDFTVRSAQKEGSEDVSVVLVKRNSDKAAGEAVHGQRGRRAAVPATEGAAAAGVDANATAAATPAKAAKAAK